MKPITFMALGGLLAVCVLGATSATNGTRGLDERIRELEKSRPRLHSQNFAYHKNDTAGRRTTTKDLEGSIGLARGEMLTPRSDSRFGPPSTGKADYILPNLPWRILDESLVNVKVRKSDQIHVAASVNLYFLRDGIEVSKTIEGLTAILFRTVDGPWELASAPAEHRSRPTQPSRSNERHIVNGANMAILQAAETGVLQFAVGIKAIVEQPHNENIKPNALVIPASNLTCINFGPATRQETVPVAQ